MELTEHRSLSRSEGQMSFETAWKAFVDVLKAEKSQRTSESSTSLTMQPSVPRGGALGQAVLGEQGTV